MSDGKTRRRMNEREWQCFEDGVTYERERIIKLLEDFDKENASCQCCFTELCVNDAIALIKGEK